jgi:sporulation protein YlmC with PRC-barrel domain
MEIRLSDLQGKEVTTLTGEKLGRIANLIIESTTGELDKLLCRHC